MSEKQDNETRTYRWWESVEAGLLGEIRGQIEDGKGYGEIFADLDLGIRCDIELRTFQEYCTAFKRSLRIQRASERAAYRRKLCAALGVEVGDLDAMRELKISTIVETIASEAKEGVRLRAVGAHDFLREVDIKEARDSREEEKLAWLREQRERKTQADQKAGELLKERGRGDLAADIREIYGVVIEP